jgi:hypothetical protein
MSAADATWEQLEGFSKQFPSVQLEDELFEKGGRDVMWGQTYRRRNKATRERSTADN